MCAFNNSAILLNTVFIIRIKCLQQCGTFCGTKVIEGSGEAFVKMHNYNVKKSYRLK